MSMLRAGKYDIEDEVGRGGMAVVYRALDPVIRRPVALKVLPKAELASAEGGGALLERFRREAQAAGSLLHQNIVAIYEYGEDEANAFIAMELVEGRSLRDHLLAGWRPDLKTLPEVIEQMLEALDYSHSLGVVHRDIKPGNILISQMGVAKISDFGIARIERSHLTQAGEVLGTPFYMSPEQFNGQPADERSDVYSAAVIVFEVLAGKRPFDGQGGYLLKQILEDPPPAPTRFNPVLPAQLDAIMAQALAKRPEARYQSAGIPRCAHPRCRASRADCAPGTRRPRRRLQAWPFLGQRPGRSSRATWGPCAARSVQEPSRRRQPRRPPPPLGRCTGPCAQTPVACGSVRG